MRESSVHCADIEGINVKPRSANSFVCQTFGKTQTSHRAPSELNFSDPTTSQIRGIWLTPTTDITST